jgi:hypothetical protein
MRYLSGERIEIRFNNVIITSFDIRDESSHVLQFRTQFLNLGIFFSETPPKDALLSLILHPLLFSNHLNLRSTFPLLFLQFPPQLFKIHMQIFILF